MFLLHYLVSSLLTISNCILNDKIKAIVYINNRIHITSNMLTIKLTVLRFPQISLFA